MSDEKSREICSHCIKHRCVFSEFGKGPVPDKCARWVKGVMVIFDERRERQAAL